MIGGWLLSTYASNPSRQHIYINKVLTFLKRMPVSFKRKRAMCDCEILRCCFLKPFFQLSDIFLVDPFFAVATITANISVNQHGGEDRHSGHDVIAGPICTCFSFYPQNIGASALGTYSSILHNLSPFPLGRVYLEASF